MPSKQLTLWLQAHQAVYIAYPIMEDAVASVLTSGYVTTPEQQIREIKSLSKEQVAAADQLTNDVSHFIEQIKNDGTVFTPVVRVVANASIDFTHALLLEMVDNQVYESLAQNKPEVGIHLLSNGKAIELQRKRKGNPIQAYDVVLSGVLWAECDANNKERLKYSLHQQLAIDSLAEEPIDLRLSKVWESCKAVCNKPRLFSDMLALREKEIKYSRNDKELNVIFNLAPWANGDVFILRGQPLELLSVSNQMTHRMDCHHKGNYLPTNGQMVKLLCPFENKGQALSLALAQEHTIVLGPEAILAPYIPLLQERNMAFCTFEAMLPEHIALLGSPILSRRESSCSSGSVSPSDMQEKKLEALKTMTLFAQRAQKQQLQAAFERWKEVTPVLAK